MTREPLEHDLKCWPEFFQPLIEGRKPFDYRLNDRDFQVGDVLHQREFVPDPDPDAKYAQGGSEKPEDGFYTGRSIRHRVIYMLDVDKLGPAAGVRAQPTAGFVIMALGPVEADEPYEVRAGYVHPSLKP